MKVVYCSLLVLFLASCSGSGDDTDKQQQNQINMLRKQLSHSYRPGLGEFMLGIQMHHQKLWFAGQAQNWLLADFEIDEIEEAINNIKIYNADRFEVNSISMIEPDIDSVNNAIIKKDTAMFRDAYIQLTNTCNGCHFATHHGFNVIKVPDVPPVSDQVFKPQ